jgi:hypothetical protein
MLTILKYLKGSAGTWAREWMLCWEKYQEFEEAFKRQIWNRKIQREIENDLLGNGNFVWGSTDLMSYVLSYYEKCSYLDNQIPMNEFVAAIAHHLPSTLSIPLITAKNINDKEELIGLIKKLASISKVDEQPARLYKGKGQSDQVTARPSVSYDRSRQGDERGVDADKTYRPYKQYQNNPSRNPNENRKEGRSSNL